MKSLLFKSVKFVFFLLLFSSLLYAQAPQKMSYQVVVRNASNVLVANSIVGIKISILQTSIVGTVVYSETHSVITNLNGLATLEIGGGVVQSGDFATINWVNSPYFIKTETDPTGGTNYTISGTSQLLSVPYALFAEKTNPVSPVFVSSEYGGNSVQTLRNTWVDHPNILIIVPETGLYQISFFGALINGNSYFSSSSSYDNDGEIRVYDDTAALQLYSKTASAVFIDASDNVSSYYRRYTSISPSCTIVRYLGAGNVLKLQFKQNSSGAPSPSTNWLMINSGISIIKIGN